MKKILLFLVLSLCAMGSAWAMDSDFSSAGDSGARAPVDAPLRHETPAPSYAVVAAADVARLRGVAAAAEKPMAKRWQEIAMGEHEYPVSSVTFNSHGTMIASGSLGSDIKVWDSRHYIAGARPSSMPDLSYLRTLKGHDCAVNSVVCDPGGNMLASGSSDKTIKFWDLESGVCLRNLTGHKKPVAGVAFASDRITLVSASGDGTIKLWDLRDRRGCMGTLRGHEDAICAVTIKSDNITLASGSADTTVRLWDMRFDPCMDVLRGHMRAVTAVAFRNDTPLLASGSLDRTVKVWDLMYKTCKKDLRPDHADEVFAVAFSPDATALASGSGFPGRRGEVTVWDLQNNTYVNKFSGHFGYVRAVAFSPDSAALVSGGDDKTVGLCQLKS